MVDASERLEVLLTQEEYIYKTADYLTKLQATEAGVVDATFDPKSSPSSPKKRKSLDDDGMDCEDQEDSTDREFQAAATATSTSGASESSSNSQMNKHWREKICEWAYQGTNDDTHWWNLLFSGVYSNYFVLNPVSPGLSSLLQLWTTSI